MIYKFIDINGSEISVNSLESLQALVDSETINENTKVKAGLRGKWTTASVIEGLNFTIEEEIQNTTEPEEDIKSFITQSENSAPQEKTNEEVKTKAQDNYEREYIEQIVEEEAEVNEVNEEEADDNSDYYTEKFSKPINQEEIMGVNLPEAVRICFKKYFDFKGRATRSEYWYFVLFILIGYVIGFCLMLITPVLSIMMIIFFIAIIIPGIAVAARRLHDINKSGWFQLIPIPAGIFEAIFAYNRQAGLEVFFMIIGLGCYIYLIVLYCTEGDSKVNRFGKNPLKFVKKQKYIFKSIKATRVTIEISFFHLLAFREVSFGLLY